MRPIACNRRNFANRLTMPSKRYIAHSQSFANTIGSFHAGRSRFLVFLITLCFLGLAIRAIWIAGPGNAFYQQQGDLRVRRQLDVPPTRGRILDRNGHTLAQSLPAGAIYLSPRQMVSSEKYTGLAEALGMPLTEIEAASASDRGFVYLRRQTDAATLELVKTLALPGVGTVREFKRVYPSGPPFDALLGLVNLDGIGIEGLELALNDRLKGARGRSVVEKDRLGNILSQLVIAEAEDGGDIHLSIDERLQTATYQALQQASETVKARSSLAVVTDVKTGEILAAASWHADSSKRRAAALIDAFEPGSIIKPLIVAGALELKRVAPDTLIETNGRFDFAGAKITDVRNFGQLSVAGVIEKSSNIGMVKIVSRLSPDELWTHMHALGFGRKADSFPFPGLGSGRMHSARGMTPITQATMAYGYGLTASALQIAQAYAAIGNRGQLIPLTLERRPAGSETRGTQVLTPATAEAVLAMLERVTGAGGSGRQARVNEYRVGGKTGTAYLHVPGRGYDKKRYRASFAGVAPLSAPEIAVVVSVEDPSEGSHFGGKVAAPIFAQIVSRAMQLRHVVPDAPPAEANIAR
ncbi:cell division protein FtsI (penicillin-binding protein 3) [Cupriavidus metallidurans]|jgi:cell division protein FtsI (penicillin-binding protein 3)|uniref:peptidoglycan D,D-transpeptidase FtsI family protein n=2 Tax=Burkholderiaceae TaxID=119060 RepID=UPI000493746F|nr:penicillin-binding protein 2 [Cupriavidus metallidurans]AVA36240.1 penicillin-binding protein 2 [Cupriavidus metallidurans]KWW37678.1 Penicillin-binding protein 2 [Cupriavidus metallidurans]